MARYLSGLETVTVSTPTAIKDRNGTPTDATTITLTMHQPDGTVKTYTPTHDGVGLYHQDIPLTDTTQLGMYQWVMSGTIAATGFGFPGNFDVYDPYEVTILALQDAKDMLSISQTNTINDREILRKIATIQANIEKTTGGPTITRQITNERIRAGTGYRTLTVRYRPLVSVVSIADTSNGVAISLTDLDIDYPTGVIRRKLQLPFFSWGPYYLVTYTAGLGVAVPPGIEEACAIILKHLWDTQRANAPVPFGGSDDLRTLPGWDFGIPPRAADLLSPQALEVYF